MSTINVDPSKYVLIPLRQLIPAPWNYKQTGEETDAAKARLRAGMQSRGQIINLIVRELPGEMFEVLNGNHRLELMQEDGVEEAMCYNAGPIDQGTAQVMAVETNGEYIQADRVKLGEVLRHASETVPLEEMLATLPMSPVEVDAAMRGVDLVPDPKPEKKDEDAPASNRVMIGMTLPRELGEEFKAQLKRFETDAQAIEFCVTHLKGIAV